MADFGNPLVLGGNFEVLSTKIFFAVVGAAHRSGPRGRAGDRAARLHARRLLAAAALARRQELHHRQRQGRCRPSGDACRPASTVLCYRDRRPLGRAARSVIYAIILIGGFVKTMGRDYTPTLRALPHRLSPSSSRHGLFFEGAAWPSPVHDARRSRDRRRRSPPRSGLLTAYLLTRQRFAGRRLLDFATMLSFAIPGTVVGVAYILAFNVPPIEITGTARSSSSLLRLPQHAGGRALRAWRRSRRSTRASTRPRSRSARAASRRCAGRAAAAATRARRCADLRFRARHDGGQRRDLPRVGAIQHGDRLHHRPGRCRRISASPSPIPRC